MKQYYETNRKWLSIFWICCAVYIPGTGVAQTDALVIDGTPINDNTNLSALRNRLAAELAELLKESGRRAFPGDDRTGIETRVEAVQSGLSRVDELLAARSFGAGACAWVARLFDSTMPKRAIGGSSGAS